ncbi:MAG: hypothetical protein K2N80_03590 [Lachnospiraceae bacterium]|nr:hypothetical protein [Lachnospiraceae bacterium]
MKKKVILSVGILFVLCICIFCYLFAYKPYAESTDQYSIALSLESDESVSEEQIETYKTILEKQEFAEITLTVNGEVR